MPSFWSAAVRKKRSVLLEPPWREGRYEPEATPLAEEEVAAAEKEERRERLPVPFSTVLVVLLLRLPLPKALVLVAALEVPELYIELAPDMDGRAGKLALLPPLPSPALMGVSAVNPSNVPLPDQRWYSSCSATG